MPLRVGDIIRTSHDTGPYRIIEITRDCRCPDYVTVINCDRTPCDRNGDCYRNCPLTAGDEPHIHLVCVRAEEPVMDRYPRKKLYWLNGYREYPDGTIESVWHPGDYIIVEGFAAGSQLSLF